MLQNLRKGDRDAWRRWAHALVDQLLDLRFETDPAAGATSAESKDLKAFRALRLLGDLTSRLGDWAIHHEVGLAAADLVHVPPIAWSGKQDTDFVAARVEVDDHTHEITGEGAVRAGETAWRSGHSSADPDLQRRILINLLAANPGGFPESVATALAVGLKALSYNETQPILVPRREGRKVNFSEIQAQLEAIALVEYRVTRGALKYRAQDEVAATFCVSRPTLAGWEYRLQQTHPLEVTQAKASARSAALNVEQLQKTPHDPTSWDFEFYNPDRWDRKYGAEMLEAASQRYKASQNL